MNILAEALGGANIGNCGHACESRPCGDAECRPLRDRFTCRCRPGLPHPCPGPDIHVMQLRYTTTGSATSTLLPKIPMPTSVTQQQQRRYERTVPSFTGDESYLHFDDAETIKRLDYN